MIGKLIPRTKILKYEKELKLKKNDPSEDMKILKRICDITNFTVPEELIKYL
jgi:hypothetical protein